MPLPRCPQGSRRNKKTGECEPYKKKSPKHSPKHSPKKRCPPGSRRNKKTGKCESYKKQSPKQSPKQLPKRVSPVQYDLSLSVKGCTSSEQNAYVCMNEIQNKYPYIVPKRLSSPKHSPKRVSSQKDYHHQKDYHPHQRDCHLQLQRDRQKDFLLILEKEDLFLKK